MFKTCRLDKWLRTPSSCHLPQSSTTSVGTTFSMTTLMRVRFHILFLVTLLFWVQQCSKLAASLSHVASSNRFPEPQFDLSDHILVFPRYEKKKENFLLYRFPPLFLLLFFYLGIFLNIFEPLSTNLKSWTSPWKGVCSSFVFCEPFPRFTCLSEPCNFYGACRHRSVGTSWPCFSSPHNECRILVLRKEPGRVPQTLACGRARCSLTANRKQHPEDWKQETQWKVGSYQVSVVKLFQVGINLDLALMLFFFLFHALLFLL